MKQIHILEDPVRKVFFSYLIPSVSATFVTSIYILADTVMIGHGIGAVGIAALNILLPLYNTFFGVGMMCGVGGSVLFGVRKGQGNLREAREYFTMGLLMMLFISILASFAGNLFFRPLLSFLGMTPSMEAYTVPYARILVTAAPVFALSSFLQVFVRNDDAPKLSMTGVIAGGVTNVILDYVYIFIMKWGMTGAVLATVTGTTLTVLILCTHFFSKENNLKLVKNIRFRKMGEILGNGMSSFILEVSNGVVTLLFNRQLLFYIGDIGVVVYGIISNTACVVISVSNGIAQTVQPILSANFGAGKRGRVLEARRLGLIAALSAGVVFAGSGYLFPVQLSHLFLEPTEEILRMAVPAIHLYFASFLIGEWNILYGTYFQSVVRPGLSLLITLLRGVILNSILVFLLPALFGVDGIWITVTVSEFITALVTTYLIRKERKELTTSVSCG